MKYSATERDLNEHLAREIFLNVARELEMPGTDPSTFINDMIYKQGRGDYEAAFFDPKGIFYRTKVAQAARIALGRTSRKSSTYIWWDINEVDAPEGSSRGSSAHRAAVRKTQLTGVLLILAIAETL